MHLMASTEGKPIVQDKLSEVAASLISAYDSGEILEALSEGRSGWQKWIKNFGKYLKRKVGSCSRQHWFILSLF
jgi:glutamyl-tRNA synthetase